MNSKKKYNQYDYDEIEKKDSFYEFKSYKDNQNIKLKENHQKYPIIISPDCRIFLETFSEIYRLAYDFLIKIAEPVSRPLYVHEYQITQYSLYAAMVLQMRPEKIKEILRKLSKNEEIPDDVITFIDKNTKQYGSVKLFLENNKYYLEVLDKNFFVNNNDLQKIRKIQLFDEQVLKKRLEENLILDNIQFQLDRLLKEKNIEKVFENVERLANQQEQEQIENKFSEIYEIIDQDHTAVTKAIIEQNIPLIEEYDFQNDKFNPNLEIELRPSTKIRHYQEKALSNVFIGGKARSGVVVLPCGAGKTLVGIVAATTIKKRTIIFCNTDLAIQQWESQLKLYTDINPQKILKLSSKYLEDEKYTKFQKDAFIVITTYNMVSKDPTKFKKTNYEKTQKRRDMIANFKQQQWGLVILDEVQVCPAKTFQKVLQLMKSYCKLGLTATLIREDNKIEDLNYMIGPKLYEENWLDLVSEGFLARPYCIEIRCPMTAPFLKAYADQKNFFQKNLIYAGNPNKFIALQYLIKKHEERGDKIIVFGDRPWLLKKYGKMLKIAVATGEVSHDERMTILDHFQRTTTINTIFLTSIGDSAIDLPGANVVIQISSQFGSRRQEAQRLGRILRPKDNDGQYNAFFYTLVSLETDETYYASKRQRFLIDQGFSFEIVNHLPYMKNEQIRKKYGFLMDNEQAQQLHLQKIIEDGVKIEEEEEFDNIKEKKIENDESDSDFDETEDLQMNQVQDPSNRNQMVYAQYN